LRRLPISEAAAAIAAYEPPAGLDGPERLVLENLRLVVKIVHNYNVSPYRRFMPGIDDMIQAGVLGLMRAAGWDDRRPNGAPGANGRRPRRSAYDPQIGKFSTYAAFWVRQAVSAMLTSAGSGARGGRPEGEAAMLLGSFGEAHFGDVAIGSVPVDDAVAADDEVARLRAAISRLPDRQADIVCGYFGIDRPCETLTSMAARYGLSTERVRQIREEAIDSLRAEI
jgi:RNA polymerase sigma factor (sigma-70 family)